MAIVSVGEGDGNGAWDGGRIIHCVEPWSAVVGGPVIV